MGWAAICGAQRKGRFPVSGEECVGCHELELDTPALLIDLDAMERNIARMADFLEPLVCNLRPHMKTHKCPEIARLQLAAGARGVTCAKLGEAEVMAAAGIRDILIANQIVGQKKTERLAALAGSCEIIVAVDDRRNVREIARAAATVGTHVGMLIEVNVGMDRCGVESTEEALALADEVDAHTNVNLRGVMGYEGHAVFIEDFDEREAVARAAARKLLAVRDALEERGYALEIVSAGGTGTYNITSRIPGITEIQAGSYVVMDAQYRKVTRDFDCALEVLATVISRPTAERVVLDAGRKSLSTDFGLPEVVGVEGLSVTSLSEEHATLAAKSDAAVQPGDKLRLVPSHCCGTINLHDTLYARRDGHVEAVWPVAARGKCT